MENTRTESEVAKGISKLSKEIKRIRKKWMEEKLNVRTQKYLIKECHLFLEELIEQGKITRADLKNKFTAKHKIKEKFRIENEK